MANILSKNAIDRQFDERRQSSRVYADLAVRVAVLKSSQHDLYNNTFDELRRRFLMSVEFNRLTIEGRAALKKSHLPNSMLGVFAESVEKRVDVLAGLSGLAAHAVSPQNMQRVELGDAGIKFEHPENIDPGTLVCLRLVSYESPMLALIVLATVVHCSVEADDRTGAHVGVAVKIEHANSDDLALLKSFVVLRESQIKMAA